MAKVKVIAPFLDKVEDKVRKLGEEFEADAKRISELNARGPEQNGMPLVEVVPEPKRKPAKAAPEKPEEED